MSRKRGLPFACAVVCGFVAGPFLLTATSTSADPPPLEAKGKPQVGLPGIVFVAAPIFDEKTDGGDGVYQGSFHWRDGFIYPRSATYHRGERTDGPPRPGRNLYALVPARPDGKLTRLTHLETGAVYRPEPSFDGRKVLFAMRRDGEDWFHLYEVQIDGTCLRQLTDGPFNDFAGVYLPDGRIVFCSDRTGYLEEYHEERTETLFVMNGDGRNLRQITFLPGTYFEPSVMQDGRILFSFWDAFHIDVPPFDKHETYLMTVNPDGTDERHLFGAGQYRFFNRERHSGIGVGQARELSDGRVLCQTEMGPSLLDLRAGLSPRDALAPVFPGTTSVQLGGTTHRAHLSPLGTRSTPYPLPDGRFLFSATSPGARDSAIFTCDPDTREEALVLNIPNYAEFDAVPVLATRRKPNALPTQVKPNGTTTRFLVVAGRTADNPQRAEALKRARYFRVIEAEYTGVTTSSHTNLETRILGVVPIFSDGSVYFEAPADTPLFLDPVDAAGNRVLMEWSYPHTAVATGLPYPATQMAYMSGRAGETKACYGCHATQTDAVPNATIEAIKYPPVQVTRESTDLQYRRNEPEAYRRQARVGEAEVYQKWSWDGDPAVRVRGCEMLMHVGDMGRRLIGLLRPVDGLPCIPVWRENGPEVAATLTGALREGAVDVRRAASLALTRLGTADDAPRIEESLRDPDYLVRFNAAAACEAIGPIKGLPGERVLPFESLARRPATPESLQEIRAELRKPHPEVLAIRAAGMLRDAEAVPLLTPWLTKHEWEYHAAEAAVALGRISTPEAVAALWGTLRSEVPNRKVHISRYLQHGPRPEEYALLKGLLLAHSAPEMKDVHLLVALLPNTFMEKPRFEDRLRSESQRVLMPRLLLEAAGTRQRAVEILWAALRGEQKAEEPLYQQFLKGINLERPFSEHGRPFPVVTQISGEEALWLLGCLIDAAEDLKYALKRQELEELLVPFLTSKNHRERIDAAVLLGLTGFGPRAGAVLAAEVAKPYSFPEIASIGKGMPDDNFRDKAYFIQTLARHVRDVGTLRSFADPRKMTRDIRYGLTHGLAFRGKEDGIPLLVEMASRDPITLIRQQARYALADIQDGFRLAGRPVPEVNLPEPEPLEALYPPRGLTWYDTRFVELPGEITRPPADAPGLNEYVSTRLVPRHFRNLNNAQAAGAQRMMIQGVEETCRGLSAWLEHPGEVGRQPLLKALDTPYPFIHYLAAKTLAERGEAEAIPVLTGKLDVYVKAQDPAGFWWCCEALGRLKAHGAVPTLARYAVEANPTGVTGPEGMGLGYIAAKALAQVTADPRHAEVARCLSSDNVWLRAGALRGLAEAKSPNIEKLLRAAAEEVNPAVVRQEARVQLRRMETSR